MQLAFNSVVFYFVMMAVTVTSVDGAGQRYCGEALVQAMAYVCGDRGYFGLTSGIHGRSVSRSPFLSEERANSFLTNERTRSRRTGRIVTECCENPCSRKNLESYCNVATTTAELPTDLTTEDTTTEPAASPRRSSRTIEADGSQDASTERDRGNTGKGNKGKGNRRRDREGNNDPSSAGTDGNTEQPPSSESNSNGNRPTTEERPRNSCRGSAKKKKKCRNQNRNQEVPAVPSREVETTASSEISSTASSPRGKGKGQRGKGNRGAQQSEEVDPAVTSSNGCEDQDPNCGRSSANAGGSPRRPGKGKGKGGRNVASSEQNPGDAEEETTPTPVEGSAERAPSRGKGKGQGGSKKLSKAEKKRQRKLLRQQEKANRKAERKTGKKKSKKGKSKQSKGGDRERRTTVRWNNEEDRLRRQTSRDSFTRDNRMYTYGPYRKALPKKLRRTVNFRRNVNPVRRTRRRRRSPMTRKQVIEAR